MTTLNTRPYDDEIRFAARQFSASYPEIKVSVEQGFLGNQTDFMSVVIRTNDGAFRELARAALQGIGDYAHVEEYDDNDPRIDFTWLVG